MASAFFNIYAIYRERGKTEMTQEEKAEHLLGLSSTNMYFKRVCVCVYQYL